MTSKTLTAPAVALGTWAWGDSGEVGDGYFGSELTASGLREVVEKAQSSGFTLWDTAVVYGMGHSEVYDGILPQLQTLTDRMGAIGKDRGASAADVAIAWPIAKGTTPIIGVTKAGYIDGLVRAHGIELADEEIAELEALADAADVDTRGWWEHEM